MKTKICLIAPSMNLYQTAQEVVEESKDEFSLEIEIRFGNLDDGVAAAKEAIANGAEAVISRGGTAYRIAEKIPDIPLVEIKVDAMDILRTVLQIDKDVKNVGLLSYSNVIYQCKALKDLIGLDVKYYLMRNPDETKQLLKKAQDDGVKILISGAKAYQEAIEYGMESYVFISGKDSVMKSIKDAESVVMLRKKERENVELLQEIINSATDGVLVVDVQGKITLWNSTLISMLPNGKKIDIGVPIDNILPNTKLKNIFTSGKAEAGAILKAGGRSLALRWRPVSTDGKVIGAIANFQEISQLQSYERDIRQKLHDNGLVAQFNLDDIIGESLAIQQAKDNAQRYAATDSPVLITGESGTGKEMFAQAIHQLSKRKYGPFVAINCGAFPESLLESELFGYDEGTFTGAKKGGKAGLFELAHGGTLFLDEIGDMPFTLQNRLLRVLQEQSVMRLGGNKLIPVDVRIIAATNQDIKAEIADKKFRLDLYYRLDVLRIHLPSLKDRHGDVPVLANYFLDRYNHKYRCNKTITTDALGLLEELDWQGNIREMMNLIERVVLLTDDGVIDEKALENLLPEYHNKESFSNLKKLESSTIEKVLEEENYNYSKAAKRLGIGRTTLWRKINK